MMSRPGTAYTCAKAIEIEDSTGRMDDPDPIETRSLSEENANDLQILLLQRVYGELKEVSFLE